MLENAAEYTDHGTTFGHSQAQLEGNVHRILIELEGNVHRILIERTLQALANEKQSQRAQASNACRVEPSSYTVTRSSVYTESTQSARLIDHARCAIRSRGAAGLRGRKVADTQHKGPRVGLRAIYLQTSHYGKMAMTLRSVSFVLPQNKL